MSSLDPINAGTWRECFACCALITPLAVQTRGHECDVDQQRYSDGYVHGYWQDTPVQETGCVVRHLSLSEPECLSDIATDVTRIAAPMAFSRGVKFAHPVMAMSETNKRLRMAISFVHEYTPDKAVTP